MSEKPLTILRLSLTNVLAKPWRNFGLAALVAVFSMVLFAGTVIDRQLSKGLESLSQRLGADLLIVPYGYERTAKAALLRGEPGTYYMSDEVYERLKNFPGVTMATPQFFLASLATSCCSERVQIIGIDQKSDFLMTPWLDSKVGDMGLTDIVTGSKLNIEIGGQLYFFGQIHTVVAKMEPTGMGLDTSVLLPIEGVRGLIGSNPELLEKLQNPKSLISAVALKIDRSLKVKDVANAIMKDAALEYNLDMVLPDAIVTETSRQLAGWSRLTAILAMGLWVLAFLVLILVFSITAGERKKEFGVYRLLGAKRSWLGRLILTEAFLVSLGGALIGLILASCAIFPFQALIFGSLGLPHLPLTPSEIAIRCLFTLVLALIVSPLAVLRTVLSITRREAGEILRSAD
ncbi:MAG: ABC transporter permease [Deltaproteobacteria bacterium]|jgi:putative ABC transport system permease protein|nr:ABC transporter permease [Deltaproteobacteria bacterium]